MACWAIRFVRIGSKFFFASVRGSSESFENVPSEGSHKQQIKAKIPSQMWYKLTVSTNEILAAIDQSQSCKHK